MFYKVYAAIIIFVSGLMVGSFDNVAIYRIPEGKSLVTPRSFCPKCGVQLTWYENIPVFSYLFLRGHCRHCGQPISIRYPLVELSSGLLFLAVFAKCGFAWAPELLPYLFMITVLVIVSAIDLEKQIIPNKIIYPSLVIALASMGLVALAKSDLGYFVDKLLGMVVIGVPLILFALIYPKGMGMGDGKLAAFTGIFLGWKYELVGFAMAILLGGLVSAGLLAMSKKGRKARVPFGPFLAAGALMALFWGPTIVEWYTSLL